MLIKILATIVVAYGLVVAAGFAMQRRLLYPVDRTYVSPAAAGLRNVTEQEIRGPDGVRVLAWYGAAKPGKPTLLYFHGNGGSLAVRTPRIERFMGEGWGVFMMTYRGYGGSGGSPTETDNIADAVRAYDTLVTKGVAATDIVLYGESLGTGVATRLALQRPAAGLILDAPYTSIPDVAQRAFWFLPVRLLMCDRYETSRIIDKINIPLLIIHGSKDTVVPVDMGRDLARLAREPKTLVVFPNGGHSNLYIDGNGALAAVRSFIDGLRPRRP